MLDRGVAKIRAYRRDDMAIIEIDEEIMPIVVFITAYDEYALKAFEENALDYLLKAVEKERLTKTVKKLKKRLQEGSHSTYMGPEITKIPCLLSNRIKLVSVADVEYVRSDFAGGVRGMR